LVAIHNILIINFAAAGNIKKFACMLRLVGDGTSCQKKKKKEKK